MSERIQDQGPSTDLPISYLPTYRRIDCCCCDFCFCGLLSALSVDDDADDDDDDDEDADDEDAAVGVRTHPNRESASNQRVCQQ